jgi:hypothetical protein
VAKWMGSGDGGLEPATHIEEEFGEDDIPPEDWSEWEWILSPSEEFLQKHSQWQMEKTESELNTLRGPSSQVCVGNYIYTTCNIYVNSHSSFRLHFFACKRGRSMKCIPNVTFSCSSDYDLTSC